MAMIVAKFHLLQIERKLFLGHAMKFSQPFLCVAPKSFQAIDVDLPLTEVPFVVDPQMAIAAKHQRVIAPPAVGVHNAAPPDFLERPVQQRRRADIGDRLDPDGAVSLENSENRDLAGRASAPLALAPAPKVGLIGFDLPTQQFRCGLRHDGLPEPVAGSQGGRIAHAHFPGDAASRHLQLEQFEDPDPFDGRNPQAPQEAARPIRKPIAAPHAPVPPAHNRVDATAPAVGAKFLAVFPTRLTQIPASLIFGLYPSSKFLNGHAGTSLLPVPNVLQSPY
jgi:hypothetical protein